MAIRRAQNGQQRQVSLARAILDCREILVGERATSRSDGRAIRQIKRVSNRVADCCEYARPS